MPNTPGFVCTSRGIAFFDRVIWPLVCAIGRLVCTNPGAFAHETCSRDVERAVGAFFGKGHFVVDD